MQSHSRLFLFDPQPEKRHRSFQALQCRTFCGPITPTKGPLPNSISSCALKKWLPAITSTGCLQTTMRMLHRLKNMPVLFITDDWRDIAYQWFTKKSMKDTFLVFKSKATPEDTRRFQQRTGRLEQVRAHPLSRHRYYRKKATSIRNPSISRPLKSDTPC